MPDGKGDSGNFLKSLGFPELKIHHSFNHFDFSRPGRRILVIGPMGSGKTEFSARMWRDSRVALRKTGSAAASCRSGDVDRRDIFFVRSSLDGARFPDYPEDALAYRGGFERLGDRIAHVRDSFALEELIDANPVSGTWIVDEAAFYDERIAYLTRNESLSRGLVFVFPTLILNFRREIFNATAKLLLDHATDVFPLTAYCEHDDCLADSFYTYRYYTVDGKECPAPYFDPLIVIGGDRAKVDPREPNYCTRCDNHHYLPGKEYTFFFLKPEAERAAAGSPRELERELELLRKEPEASRLAAFLSSECTRCEDVPGRDGTAFANSLLIPCLAEKALVYLYAEQNIVKADQVSRWIDRFDLDSDYLSRRLGDMRRPLHS